MIQKTTKIIVNKTLERPPLNIYGKYFKLYLLIIKKNQFKEVTFSFKVNIQTTLDIRLFQVHYSKINQQK